MNRAEHQENSTPLPAARRRLIFALFATPAAWLLHENVSVAIVGRACGAALSSAQWVGLVTVSIAALLIALFALSSGFRVFRMRSPKSSLFKAEGWDLIQFLALFAVLVGFFLLINIIYFGVLPFVVEPCIRNI